MTLLMMGSAEALPEEPADRPMFVEDMTEEQLASAVSKPQNYRPRLFFFQHLTWPHTHTPTYLLSHNYSKVDVQNVTEHQMIILVNIYLHVF